MLRQAADKGAERRWADAKTAEQKKDSAGFADERRVDEEATTACALVGPPGSGKTAFVAALGRAGLLTSSSSIGCLPLGHASWLTVDASQALRRGDSLSSVPGSDRSFPFSISTAPTGVWTLNGDIGRLVLRDLDCAPLFLAGKLDEEARAGQVFRFDELRDAEALVLFVDSIAPRSDDWQVALLRILDELMDPSRSRSGRGRGWNASVSWPRVLPQRRVLVLLSRFDLFCEEVLESAQEAEGGLLLRGLTPFGLARRVDTVAQVVERVGPAVLNALLSALGSTGQLAVGWISAGGFTIDNGEPMLDAGGRPRRAGGADDLLGSWQPLGHLEAVEWLVTGRHKGAIQGLSRSMLNGICGDMVAPRRRETGNWSFDRACS